MALQNETVKRVETVNIAKLPIGILEYTGDSQQKTNI